MSPLWPFFLILTFTGSTLAKQSRDYRAAFDEMTEYKIYNLPASVLQYLRIAFPHMYHWEDITSSKDKKVTFVWIPSSEKKSLDKLLHARKVKYQEIKEEIIWTARKEAIKMKKKRDEDLLPDLSFSGLVSVKPFGVGDNRLPKPFKIPSYLKDTKLTDFSRVELW